MYSEFRDRIWEFYAEHRRPMPWRDDPAPYHVLVSEIMLQQTQVARVLPKYHEFLAAFPTVTALAQARLVDLLAAWQGMGYNRRALYLQQAAQTIVRDYAGSIPRDPAELVKLPGVGPNTAGSIAAFAFNEPVIFIETNIRRVFLHHFFAQASGVPDSELRPLVGATLDRDNPRQWYYALMDYGAHLATTIPNPNRRSRHYAKQSRFEGSDRQIRGAIIRLMLEFPILTAQDVANRFPDESPDRIARILGQLTKEGLLSQH